MVSGIIVGIWAMLILAYGIFDTLGIDLPRSILLFVPAQLGLFQKITPENTIILEAEDDVVTQYFTAGDYLLYKTGFPRYSSIKISQQATSLSLLVTQESGVPRIPFDGSTREFDLSHNSFSIGQDGYYLIQNSSGKGTFTIVPDVFRYNDKIVRNTLIIQFFVVVVLVWVDVRSSIDLSPRQEQEIQKRVAADHSDRWAAFDEWLEEEKDKQ